MDEVAIRVDAVYKDFLLPHEKNTSLKGGFTSLLRSKTRRIEKQNALKNISFEIKKGEFFGIVGRNGSGKSTLLKILAGIYQPTKGIVQTSGKLVPFIELGVGFNPELTGRENVYLNGAMLGFSKKEIDAMYDDIVSFAELERFMDQKLKNYSSGMQVRLAFSMATRSEADILLVDEVLAVGDADFQRKCFQYFRNLKKLGTTVVFVTHDMNAVREYCDRAVLIEKASIVLEGSADKAATEYTKMFNSTDTEDRSAAGKRWGNKTIIQNKVHAEPKTINQSEDQLQIRVAYEVKKKNQEPIFGFRITRADGEPLMGTNTQILNMATGAFKPGDTGEILWTIPNFFEDGEYSVDVAISSRDGITQYDWWENAAGFKSYRANRTPYIISPKVGVEIVK
jgi:ABC-2 type transport system ATP-binding protein